MTDQERDELVVVLKEALADCDLNCDRNQKEYVQILASSRPFTDIVTDGIHQLLHDTQGNCEVPSSGVVTVNVADLISHTMSALSIGIDIGQTMVKLGAKFPRPPVN